MADSEILDPGSYVYDPDPWEFQILRDWIASYFKFAEISPEFSERLARNTGEFKMIPVPAGLYNSLRSAKSSGSAGSANPKITAQQRDLSGFASKIGQLEIIRNYDKLVALMSEFAEALERGDIHAIAQHLSHGYKDFKGRNVDALRHDIQKLIEQTDNRKIILTNAEEFLVVGEKICARVAGAWKAQLKEKQVHGEAFRLEVFFTQENESWKIYSIELV